MGTMRILDHTGDSVVTWSSDDATSILAAERAFEREARHHRLAFARRRHEPAGRANPISAFDPSVEEIIWVRPVTGG